MIDKLHYTPVEMTMAYGVISSPWCIKPLYGYISDRYTIFNWGRRRPYISYSCYMACVVSVFMNFFIHSKIWFLIAMTYISASICFAEHEMETVEESDYFIAKYF